MMTVSVFHNITFPPYSFSLLFPVPGSVVITSFPSFVTKYIIWSPPDKPNRIIIAYEVSYQPLDISQPIIRVNTTDLDTSFTAKVDAEVGTEFTFTVKAYTRVGPGNSSSVVVSTMSCEMKIGTILISLYISSVLLLQLPYKELKSHQ